MFLKFAAVIVSLGACACTLLALRQSRLQAAHELAEAQLRIRHHDERLWRLRAEIASRVAPGHVQLMASDLGPMHPLLPPIAPIIPGLPVAGTEGRPGGIDPAVFPTKSAPDAAPAGRPAAAPSDRPNERAAGSRTEPGTPRDSARGTETKASTSRKTGTDDDRATAGPKKPGTTAAKPEEEANRKATTPKKDPPKRTPEGARRGRLADLGTSGE